MALIPLTKGPANSHTLDQRHKQYTCSISTIVVNQLEEVHTSLDNTEHACICSVTYCFYDIIMSMFG